MPHKLSLLVIKSVLLLLIWMLALCPNLAAQSSTAQGRREQVQMILQEFQNKSRFPGAIAGVYFADDTSLAVAVGYANRDVRTIMRASDLLHVGSVGKTLFAALALQLIAERRLSLDDRIAQYLGRESWFARLPNGTEITVRMLLNHTSGLPQFGDEFMRGLAQFPSIERSPLDGVKSVLGAKPLHPVGTKFSYSDVNYLVLGLVIEHVSGKPAYDEIRRRLLKPLGLRRILPADRPVIPGLVPGYAGASNPFGGDEILKNGRLVFDPRFEWAAGGFVANAEDLARWIAAYCQGRAFNSKLLPEVLNGIEAPELGAGARYGLGIVIEDTPMGRAYGHGGFFPGYITWVRWYPQQRIAVALQLNTSDDALIARPIRDVMNDLVKALSQ
jgi:D-alanyl-D-alanine carboxypeptidase